MKKLNSIVDYINNNNIDVSGVIINENGKKFSHIFKDERVNIYSIGKSITALCIFILEDLNMLSLDDKMVSFFPEFSYSKNTENITIQNLLDMRALKDTSFITNMQKDDDCDKLKEYFDFECTLENDEFRYSNFCSYTLGRIVEAVSGQVLVDFANDKIFKKLDMPMPRWLTCNLGHTICAHHIFLNVEELYKIGEILRNKGIYKNHLIMTPKHFLNFEKEFNVSENEEVYRNSFWNLDIGNAYFMKGIYSNLLINIPSQNTTISITANERNNEKRDKFLEFIKNEFKKI